MIVGEIMEIEKERKISLKLYQNVTDALVIKCRDCWALEVAVENLEAKVQNLQRLLAAYR